MPALQCHCDKCAYSPNYTLFPIWPLKRAIDTIASVMSVYLCQNDNGPGKIRRCVFSRVRNATNNASRWYLAPNVRYGIIFVLFRWDSLIFFVPQIFIYTRSRVLLFAFCVLIGRYDPFRSMFNIANRETVLEHERRICFCRGAFPVISWLFINQRYAKLFANDSSLYS